MMLLLLQLFILLLLGCHCSISLWRLIHSNAALVRHRSPSYADLTLRALTVCRMMRGTMDVLSSTGVYACGGKQEG